MNYLTNVKEQAESYASQMTKLLEKKRSDNNFLITYVYFIKNYYEFLYHYNVFKKTNEIDTDKVSHIIEEINRTMGLVKDFSFKPLKVIDLKEGSSDYYKLHKSKMLKWTSTTPRSKIIKALELWTGEKGEDAVMTTIHNLQFNAQDLFSHIMRLHGFNNLTNTVIKSNFNKCLYTLFNYYIKHRDQYVQTMDTKKTKLKNNDINLSLKDEFIDVNIKFKGCDFTAFGKAIQNIMVGLKKLDTKILIDLINNPISSNTNETDIYFRKKVNQKILEATEIIMEDVQCYDVDIELVNEAKSSVEGLIKLVKEFVASEKEVEKNIELIKENMETQTANAEALAEAINILTGPDTRPCIKRLAPALREQLLKDSRNFNQKNKLTKEGEKAILSFL